VNDQLQKFMFEAAPIRGKIVSLQRTWQDVLARRDYPAPVRTMLGEMMAACALLSANLKFDGVLVMQILGNGPVKMLVVQCTSDLSMRATAKLSDDAAQTIRDDSQFTDLINANGRCVITLDPTPKQPGQQPYQGIVPLNDENGPLQSIAQVLEHYMRHSEQLDTRLWLAANHERASGLLLQKLPEDDGIMPRAEMIDADAWERICILAATLTTEELLTTQPETVLRRLFWQENIRRFEQTSPRFQCNCSREKVGAMLRMLGRAEADDVLEERGHIEIHCEFCNQRYEFDPVDIAQLFATPMLADSVAPAAKQQH